ncbi:MAG: ArsR/SmtB family transcription factor [Terriglobales bacterium]
MSNEKRKFKDAGYGLLGHIVKALGSAKRLELLDLLCQAERSVEALAEETQMSVANTSRHLQVLQAARLVEAVKQGRFVIYQTSDAAVGELIRAVRLLAERRFIGVEQMRQQFLGGEPDLVAVNRRTLLQRVRQGKVVLIDVRPVEEFRTAHIVGARPMPLLELKRRLSDLPRGKDIVAYCRGPFCVFATEAVRMLRARGRRAFRLPDSVQDWRAHRLPVASGDGNVRKRAKWS